MYSSTPSLTWALDGMGRFTPGKDPICTVQEAGWVTGPVWTGAENFASTGTGFPDRRDLSESLYRLRSPGPRFFFFRDVKKIKSSPAYSSVFIFCVSSCLCFPTYL